MTLAGGDKLGSHRQGSWLELLLSRRISSSSLLHCQLSFEFLHGQLSIMTA